MEASGNGITSGAAMLPTQQSGLGLDMVEEFFDSYLEQLQSLGPSVVAHQAHDCATGAVHQQTNFKNLVAEANQYQDYMQTIEFDVGINGASSSVPHIHTHHCSPAPSVPDQDLMSMPSFDIDVVAALSEQLEGTSDNIAPVVLSPEAAAPQFSNSAPVTSGSGPNVITTAGEWVHHRAAGSQLPITLSASQQPMQQVSEHSGYHVRASETGDDTQATSEHESGGAKAKRRRIRSDVQQEQNKAAQQRYRQRKKLKSQSLETTVEELNQQVQQLQEVAKENEGLVQEKTLLETELLEKEAQIKLLNEQLEESKERSSSLDGAAEGPGGSSGAHQCSVADIKQKWHAKMEELRNVFEVNNIRNAKPDGEGLSEDVIGTMAMLLEEVVALIGRVVRVDGLSMFDLITANVDRCDHMCDEQTREVWTRVAKLVELDAGQVSKVKVLRAEHLKKLEEVYNRRQKLNLDAISLLLPNGASIGKVGTFFSGMFTRNKSNEKLNTVLDALKNNLKEEQRLAQELEHVVLNRLLHPIQGAWYMLEAYPCYCDSLALLNGAYEVYVEDSHGHQKK